MDEILNKLDYILNNDTTDVTNEGYKIVLDRTLDKVGNRLKEIYEEVNKK